MLKAGLTAIELRTFNDLVMKANDIQIDYMERIVSSSRIWRLSQKVRA